MAYTKTSWANGATALSAENMNHIEQGIYDCDQGVSSNTSSINTLSGTVSGHTSSINSLNSTVSGHTTTINGHTSSINSLNSTVSGHTSSINSLNSTVSGHTSSISSLNSSVSTLQNQFVTGSQVFQSTQPLTQIRFTDANVIGKTHIIFGTQDAGNPVLRGKINSSTGEIMAYLSDPVTVIRLNYIAF